MMNKIIFIKKTLLFFLIFFLSGCDFSPKKTEISFLESEGKEQIIEEKNKSEEEILKNLDESPDILNETNIDFPKTKEKETIFEKKTLGVIDKIVDWGFSKKNEREIDTIIVHSSYNAVGVDVHNLEDIIYKQYKKYGVSPHYIISREGKIYRLVFEKNVAYHAGQSQVPDGRKNVNDFSIGIEIVNTKSESPNDKQYSSLLELISHLKENYKIKYILGHSEIAPGRKDDPWNFDWEGIR